MILKGSYHFKVHTKRINYDFVIKRNITFIRGDSGTGKTSLIDLLYEFSHKIRRNTGINVDTKANWIVFTDDIWNYGRYSISDNVVFIDENNEFLYTHEFARYVKNSGNYFVIITRYPYKGYPSLPYSVEEIYRMKNSGKYNYTELEYNLSTDFNEKPDIIITEDSNTGFDFFSTVTNNIGVKCKSAGGKGNLYNTILKEVSPEEKMLVIADGAAIGSEIPALFELSKKYGNIQYWLPESFEYLLLSSKMFKDNKYVQNVLSSPSDYISTDYFSWERFFTELLMKETENLPCQYSKKGTLNTCYTVDCCDKNKPCNYIIKEDKIDTILGDKAVLFSQNKKGDTALSQTPLKALNFFDLKSKE